MGPVLTTWRSRVPRSTDRARQGPQESCSYVLFSVFCGFAFELTLARRAVGRLVSAFHVSEVSQVPQHPCQGARPHLCWGHPLSPAPRLGGQPHTGAPSASPGQPSIHPGRQFSRSVSKACSSSLFFLLLEEFYTFLHASRGCFFPVQSWVDPALVMGIGVSPVFREAVDSGWFASAQLVSTQASLGL